MAPVRPRLRVAALAAALVLAGLGLAASPTVPSAPVVRAGHVVPAVGVSPHLRKAGTGSSPVLPCQTTTPVQCFGPSQIRTAYGIDRLGRLGLTGRGSTIVIVDPYSAPDLHHDLRLFDQVFGLPAAKVHIIAPKGRTRFDRNDPEQVGWSAEISLDVEWAHAIAPKATIDLVLARSSDDHDIDAALRWVAARGLGDVVSQSYGEAERCATVSLHEQHEVFQRMNARGTTVLAGSGDQGAAEPTCDGLSWIRAASAPATDPNVTAVGGTALSADRSGRYRSETVWNESGSGGAGGSGLSTVFREPRYQRPVQQTGRRSVPDVAYNAATEQGVLLAWSTSGVGRDLFWVAGGTSAGSPQWAGLIALVRQKAGHRLGNINPALYSLGTKEGARLFHDILSGTTSVVESDASGNDAAVPGVVAHHGWDFATGFGSPKADALVAALAD